MFKVLFKTACHEDVEHVKNIIHAIHDNSNNDEIIISSENIPADIVIEVPRVQKRSALIFDHSGTVHRLGFPEDIEYDELPGKNDGMKTSGGGQQNKTEKLPKECPKCHYMKPAGVYACPKCGFKPLGGEDVETDRNRKLSRLNKGTKVYNRDDKQRWWSELKGYQQYRASIGKPLSDGWCAHTYKDKFGVWPKGFDNTPKEISTEVHNFIKSKNIAYFKGRQKSGKQGVNHAN